jgi:hypothetical protein
MTRWIWSNIFRKNIAARVIVRANAERSQGADFRRHARSRTNSSRSPSALATACTVPIGTSCPYSIARIASALEMPARFASAYHVKPCVSRAWRTWLGIPGGDASFPADETGGNSSTIACRIAVWRLCSSTVAGRAIRLNFFSTICHHCSCLLRRSIKPHASALSTGQFRPSRNNHSNHFGTKDLHQNRPVCAVRVACTVVSLVRAKSREQLGLRRLTTV